MFELDNQPDQGVSISKSVMTGNITDQAECIENTQPLPLRAPWRGNSYAFPLPTFASLRLRLPASPSRTLKRVLRPRGHTPLESPLIWASRTGPKSVKRGSASGFALLTSSVRNHARSAFKRFSHPPPFAYTIRRGWR